MPRLSLLTRGTIGFGHTALADLCRRLAVPLLVFRYSEVFCLALGVYPISVLSLGFLPVRPVTVRPRVPR